jgi:hypothetical protein
MTTTRNPGVGLKLTAPRISMALLSDSPSPQSYRVNNGMMDLTERQRSQNALLSQRYAKNCPSTTSDIVLTRQARLETSKPRILRSPSSQKKCSRPKALAPDSKFYNIRGMADLTDQEVRQNKMLSSRYSAKE